jgi:hypothetical protein
MSRVKVEAAAPVQLVKFCELRVGETFRSCTQDYLKITSSDAFNFNEYTCRVFLSVTEVLPTTARLVIDE